MKKLLITPVFVGLAVGCTDDARTSRGALAPSFGVAGNSGCYTVRGTLNESGFPPNFAGTISGDLQGATVTFAPGDFVSGVVFHTPSEHTWSITGGMVPELVGMDVYLTGKTVVVFSQDNPGIGRINEHSTVQSPGSGNLTLHGTVDFTNFPLAPAVGSLEYNGVVCP